MGPIIAFAVPLLFIPFNLFFETYSQGISNKGIFYLCVCVCVLQSTPAPTRWTTQPVVIGGWNLWAERKAQVWQTTEIL